MSEMLAQLVLLQMQLSAMLLCRRQLVSARSLPQEHCPEHMTSKFFTARFLNGHWPSMDMHANVTEINWAALKEAAQQSTTNPCQALMNGFMVQQFHENISAARGTPLCADSVLPQIMPHFTLVDLRDPAYECTKDTFVPGLSQMHEQEAALESAQPILRPIVFEHVISSHNGTAGTQFSIHKMLETLHVIHTTPAPQELLQLLASYPLESFASTVGLNTEPPIHQKEIHQACNNCVMGC